MPNHFLTARWQNLLMLNYVVEPRVLEWRIPRGTELDLFDGRAYVSIVGFQFLDARLLGVPIPGHRNFEEVNLRFYVRRRVGDEIRRGVVFIKEIAPRWAVATVARLVYQENYVALPMWHEISPNGATLLPGARLAYRWRLRREWQHLRARVSGPFVGLTAGSEAEFITEHYWGYTARRDGGSSEYRVAHAPWRVAPVSEVEFAADVGALYGSEFAPALTGPPVSAFLADGSAVAVHWGRAVVAC